MTVGTWPATTRYRHESPEPAKSSGQEGQKRREAAETQEQNREAGDSEENP